MSDARYFLPDHPTLKDVYSKTDLRELLQGGKLSRSEIVLDDRTGLAHILGDLLSTAYREPPPSKTTSGLADRSPEVHVFRADTPLPEPEPFDDPDEEEDDLDEEFDEGPDDDEDEQAEAGEEGTADEPSGRRLLRPMAPGVRELAAEEPMVATRPGGGEEVVYHGRPSWLSYPKSLATFLVFGAAAVWCQMEHREIAWTVTAASVALLPLAFAALDRTTTEFFVTSRRVEMESGIVGRNSKEIRIADIRAIDVTQSGWNALIGVGTVEFFSAAGNEADVSFVNVWRPHRVKERVRALQD